MVSSRGAEPGIVVIGARVECQLAHQHDPSGNRQGTEQAGRFKKMMEEASHSSCRRLTDGTSSFNILGPLTLSGKHRARAEWAASGARHTLFTGVRDVGGIASAMKAARHAESLQLSFNVLGNGTGKLAVAGTIPIPYCYGRGPFFRSPTTNCRRTAGTGSTTR